MSKEAVNKDERLKMEMMLSLKDDRPEKSTEKLIFLRIPWHILTMYLFLL